MTLLYSLITIGYIILIIYKKMNKEFTDVARSAGQAQSSIEQDVAA